MPVLARAKTRTGRFWTVVRDDTPFGGKVNDTDPKAWLADILARLPSHPAKQIDELLPWNWRPVTAAQDAA